MSRPSERVSRRRFLGAAAAAAAGGIAAFSAADQKKPRLPKRKLGRTGLKVSVIGYGSEFMEDEALPRHILDRGVNHIDCAALYQNGNVERKLAPILAHNKHIIIATKCRTPQDGSGTKEMFLRSFEQSLQRLQRDSLDIFYVHDCRTPQAVETHGAREALDELREAGRIKCTGMSTHLRQDECVLKAIELGWYDVLLVGWSFASPKPHTEALKRAADAGIGIMTMKACKTLTAGRDWWARAAPQQIAHLEQSMGEGGKWNPYQQSIRWSLSHDFVSAVVIAMRSYEEVNEDLAAAR
ncbi:MAG: aldo/keto reductase [Armatimonadota bacterium]